MKIDKLTKDVHVQELIIQLANAINNKFGNDLLDVIRRNPYTTEIVDTLGESYKKQLRSYAYKLSFGAPMGIIVQAIKFSDLVEIDIDNMVIYLAEDLIKKALDVNE